MPRPRKDDVEATSPERMTVGRPPIISLDEMLEVATKVCEQVGIDALTMGLVADELGVSSAALYHYVTNKQALVNLVFDRAVERVEVPPLKAGPWDRRLMLFEASIRRELRRLKWGTPQPIMEGEAPSAVSRLAPIVLDILQETGADERDVMLAFMTVYVYLTGQLWYDNISRHPLFNSEPRELSQLADEVAGGTSDELFEFGFEVVLAGLRDRLKLKPRKGRVRKR